MYIIYILLFEGVAMEQCKIERINELARISKERELSAGEKSEQDSLRREFLNDIKADLRASLDRIEIVEDEIDEVEGEIEDVEELLEEKLDKVLN